MEMRTSIPAQKVVAATIGAAVAEILLFFTAALWPDVAIPPEIRASITVLAVFAVGYLTPPAARDEVVSEARAIRN